MYKLKLIDFIIQEKNYFRILGVSPSASTREVQVAYQKIIRSFNPEQFGNREDKLRAKQALEKLHTIVHILKSPLERSEYENQLREGRDYQGLADDERVKMAETHYKRGIYFESKNSLDEALEEYKEAVRCSTKIACYHSRLGLALQKKGWDGYAQAEFKIALTYDPTDTLALKYYRPNPDAIAVGKAGLGGQLLGIFSRSNNGGIRIGDILIQQGYLDKKQLDAALKQQKKEKLPLGEVLIRMGYLKPEQLARALILQADMVESS